MKSALVAEVRKLLTVRSTYVITILAFTLLAFFAGYVAGWRAEDNLANPDALQGVMSGSANFIAIFAALVALLLMAHEYRYNTIIYTLTSVTRRGYILASKLIVVTIFAVLFALVAGMLAPLFTRLGASLNGLHFVPQTIAVYDVMWRAVVFTWGYTVIGLLLATLIRSQIAALAALFIIPTTIEPLLGLILKDNSIYLPFQSLQAVITPVDTLSPGHAALVLLAYLVVGWIVAWILFLRRDAN